MTRCVSLLACLVLFTPGSQVGAAEEPRTVLSLDRDWRFHRGDLSGVLGRPITAWRWKADDRGERAAGEMASPDRKTDGGDWKDARPGQDVFHGRKGFAWFRADLPAVAARRPTLHFQSVDDNATVYLNGKRLARHRGWDDPFDVPLAAVWRDQGRNVLAVLVENQDGPGGIGETRLEGLDTKPPGPDNPLHPAYDDRAWRRVDVPHDFIVEGTFDPKADKDHGFLPVVVGWYRKTIAIPAAARGLRLWLEFDGVYRNSRMWLNGHDLGTHPSGYSSFRYDITAAARPGQANHLTVRVDPTHFEGWWYEGGGIYRHVRLVAVAPVHVAPWGVFVKAAVPEPGDGVRADATLSVSTALVNESGKAVQVALLSEVLDARGKVVAQAKEETKLDAGGRAEVVHRLPLAGARLWSLETPYLYQLRTTLQSGGGPVDRVTTPFGVRTLRFDASRGFFLNGKPVKLKGTSNHQDHAGVGIAVPDQLQTWRIAKLLEMGCNAYRCSHNPVAPELLDACDRLGMLVMDETRHLGDTYAAKSAPNTPADRLAELSSLVLRDRNHPSVIMWSICNEEPIQGTPAGGRIARAMKKRIKELDDTRPITAAMNGGHGGAGGLSFVLDLEGFNYEPAGYASFHRRFATRPLFGSETASAVGTRGVYTMTKWDRYRGDRRRGYVAAYDVNAPPWAQTAEAAWRPVAENPYVAGCFVWTGFDYKGEPTPFGWPCINSHFGILDICGFPKDAFWYYQAWWTDRPVLHLFPHWNWPGREGQEIEVWCYSNCPKVELFLGDASLGAQEMKPNGHLAWKVKYRPGVLLARGQRQGKELIARVETAGAPAAVQLEPDCSRLTAGNADVAVVAVRIVDKSGRTVPVADNEVSFTVSGPAKLLGVGNGDPSSHEPDKAAKRKAFQGLCLALVQTTGSPGVITLRAQATGLKSATVKLAAVK